MGEWVRGRLVDWYAAAAGRLVDWLQLATRFPIDRFTGLPIYPLPARAFVPAVASRFWALLWMRRSKGLRQSPGGIRRSLDFPAVAVSPGLRQGTSTSSTERKRSVQALYFSQGVSCAGHHLHVRMGAVCHKLARKPSFPCAGLLPGLAVLPRTASPSARAGWFQDWQSFRGLPVLA